MSDTPLTHHPDCFYWLENIDLQCSCGLTAPAVGKLQPWSQAAMTEWRQAVRVHFATLAEAPKP